jgi:hypothetical protein
MATVGKPSGNMPFASGEQPVSKEQLRKDRMNLALVVAVFAALIALMIWLASLGPPAGEYNFTYPLVP